MECADQGQDNDGAQTNEHGTSVEAHPLDSFNLYGWQPHSSLSDDENLMDLVLLVTRSSTCSDHGHVACLLVQPKKNLSAVLSSAKVANAPSECAILNSKAPETTLQQDDDTEASKFQSASSQMKSTETSILRRRLYESVIGAATNAPVFHPSESDIHAEIACLGQACQRRNSTTGSTAYITIHPCKRCFAALVAFGVSRIVSRRMSPPKICQAAEKFGIEVCCLTPEQNRSQMKRINELINPNRTDTELMEIVAKRREQKRRKNEKRAKNDNRKATSNGEGSSE